MNAEIVMQDGATTASQAVYINSWNDFIDDYGIGPVALRLFGNWDTGASYVSGKWYS